MKLLIDSVGGEKKRRVLGIIDLLLCIREMQCSLFYKHRIYNSMLVAIIILSERKKTLRKSFPLPAMLLDYFLTMFCFCLSAFLSFLKVSGRQM